MSQLVLYGDTQIDTLRQRERQHSEQGDQAAKESQQQVQSLQALSDSLKEELAVSDEKARAASEALGGAQQQRQQAS